jgi:RHS repeat-associated protein
VTKGKVAYYYPFGMQMAGRSFTSGDGYRYGFQGMERDDEVSGSGNAYTTEFRGYDPRLGRWKSYDLLFKSFPWQSPYVAFDNNPIYYTDPRGLAAEGGEDEENNDVKSYEFVNEEKHEGVIIRFDNDIQEEDALGFMVEQSVEVDKEISSYVLQDKDGVNSIYIMDYSENEPAMSKNQAINKDGTILLNGNSYTVLAQIHTHNYPSVSHYSEAPSQGDADAATIGQFPVYTIGTNDISRVNPNTGDLGYIYYKLNKEGTDYIPAGNLLFIGKTNQLINGEFSIIKHLRNE